jgi:alpha-tubulin suppressor-like RCC1 family protein
MTARTTESGRVAPPRRVMTVALAALAASLGTLVSAPQDALAAGSPAPSISAGGGHTCAIESGSAYCWGEQASGDLGDGTTILYSISPVAVDTSGVLAGKTLTMIASGDSNTCALDTAGAAFCWGDNTDGQLGNKTTTSSGVPVAVYAAGVLAGKTLNQITVGNGFACALDTAGAAFCWGLNVVDELGNNSATGASSSVPVAVYAAGALAGKTLNQITAGEFHACALDTAGVAFCWGDNPFGELGNNTTNSSAVPVAVYTAGVLTGKKLTQIATAGEFDTCAVSSLGAAYCWGYNADGQLGNGTTNDSDVPVAVVATGPLAGQKLTQVADGEGFNACALSSASAAYCWGANDNGELGNGNVNDADAPVAVVTSGVLAGQKLTQITGSYINTCALATGGAIYCWGDDVDGELGDRGTAAPQSDTPVLTGPGAPTAVTAAARDTQAIMSWTDPVSLDGGTLTGYIATASPGGETCTTPLAPTCTITGLTDGVTYSVTVVAQTTAGNSGASAPGTVTPTGEPTGPISPPAHLNLCVAANGGSQANDTPAVMWTCDGSGGQAWTIEADGTIQVNGKCLDIYRQEKSDNAPVELWTCHGSANQQWQPTGGTLVNPISGKCLDDPNFDFTDGTQLQILACDGRGNQQWAIP